MENLSSWRKEVETEATEIALSFINPGDNSQDGPPTVFHYTSGEGLIGILKTQTLWASQATMLNDTREVRYGLELVEGMIQSRLSAAGPNSADAMLLAAVGRVNVPQTRAFVSCFCDRGDDLGQWRGYGLTGGGYALGFEREKLRLDHNAHRDGWDLVRVIYEPDKQRSLLGRVLDSHLQMFAQRLPEAPVGQARSLTDVCATALRMVCAFVAPQIKHMAFRGEREWRLLGHAIAVTEPEAERDAERTLFRSRAGHLVPYRQIQYSALGFPLREIVVGPTTHEDIAEDAVRQLLAHSKLEGVNVRRSEVPLRP